MSSGVALSALLTVGIFAAVAWMAGWLYIEIVGQQVWAVIRVGEELSRAWIARHVQNERVSALEKQTAELAEELRKARADLSRHETRLGEACK